jgi:hypothetical protein
MREDSSRREVLKVAGAALAGAGIIAVSAGASPAAAPPEAGEEADFKGKIVALTHKDPTKGAYLQNVQSKRFGGRAFLVGTYAMGEGKDDYPEMTYWFPIENIEGITVFNSLEDVKKANDLRRKKDK